MGNKIDIVSTAGRRLRNPGWVVTRAAVVASGATAVVRLDPGTIGDRGVFLSGAGATLDGDRP
jgi:hypothetical protein